MGNTQLILLIWACVVGLTSCKNPLRKFPEDFTFGTATAALQTEGAWNVDGKGESIWDNYLHNNPNFTEDSLNADIADNSYYLYKRDIEMLKELGVSTYRLSISWVRVLPDGSPDNVNPLGIAYYNKLIDELLENDIIPFVTIYHWDMPQYYSDQGGWLNDRMVYWLADYSRVLFRHFGDRVKYWMTINEPYVHCYFGYGHGKHAPAVLSPGEGYYECARNLLLAHARIYHLYQEEFYETQGGAVGIVISMEGYDAANSDPEVVPNFLAVQVRQFMDPIFTESGNFPQLLIDLVAQRSQAQGYNSSRLRPFTPREIDYIRGTSDFLGLNHYTSKIVSKPDPNGTNLVVPSIDDDAQYNHVYGHWPRDTGFVREYAPGFYNLLLYIRDNYDNPPVYITENGMGSKSGLNDTARVNYYRNYLNAVLDALDDGCDVRGYFAWTLMDDFEWGHGYTVRYGLYEVDFEDPNRPRTPRKSALVYRDIVRKRAIDFNYDVDPYKFRFNANHAVTIFVHLTLLSILTLISLFS